MHTVVAQSLPVRLRMRLGLPVLGALVGTALALLTEWFAQVTPLYDGVLGRGGYAGEPTGLLVGAGLGLLLGLVAAITLLGECLRATVGPRAITLTWADARVSVPRRLITGIVADGDLVLLGPGGVELARVRCRLDRDRLRAALAQHGYPAPLAADPHATSFSAWVSTDPVLDSPVHRLLWARSRALGAGSLGDAELLRRQLAARGVMVRDVRLPHRRGLHQQWRPVTALLPATATARAA